MGQVVARHQRERPEAAVETYSRRRADDAERRGLRGVVIQRYLAVQFAVEAAFDELEITRVQRDAVAELRYRQRDNLDVRARHRLDARERVLEGEDHVPDRVHLLDLRLHVADVGAGPGDDGVGPVVVAEVVAHGDVVGHDPDAGGAPVLGDVEVLVQQLVHERLMRVGGEIDGG